MVRLRSGIKGCFVDDADDGVGFGADCGNGDDTDGDEAGVSAAALDCGFGDDNGADLGDGSAGDYAFGDVNNIGVGGVDGHD